MGFVTDSTSTRAAEKRQYHGVTLLGSPETLDDWWVVVRELRLRRRERLDRLGERVQRLTLTTGPDERSLGERPTTEQPGGVAAIQALVAERDLGIGQRPPVARPVGRGGLAYAVLDAVPHWLPPEATPDILHVRAPTDEMLTDLRLPYPAQSLWFATPADAGPARALLAADVRDDLRAATAAMTGSGGDDDPGGDVVVPDDAHLPDEDVLGIPWELAVVGAPLLSERPAAVVGLILLADDQGRRQDICCWIVEVPGAGGTVHVALPARRHLMRNPALVDVASALVAWGGWEAQEAPAPDVARPVAAGSWIDPAAPGPVGDGQGKDDDTGPIRILDRSSRVWIEGWRGFHIHHALMAGAPVDELTRSFGLSFADLEATWHRWAGQQQRLRDPQGRPRLSLADYEKVFGILTRYHPE
jgi:hypothetical protein